MTTATPGTALLVTAAPAGRRQRLVDVSSAADVLAAVPPGAWTATPTATVVHQVGPVDPQAVLARVRSAAEAPGPLTVLIVGQLHLDARGELHLALARTRPAALRYTAVPWRWLTSELQRRPAETTTLIVDVVADAGAWGMLAEQSLPTPHCAAYGVVVPAGRRRGRPARAHYAHALAQILRPGSRPPADRLHHEALAQVRGDLALVLGPDQPQPAPGPAGDGTAEDLHARIAALARAGRHREADAVAQAAEQRALHDHGPRTQAAVHWLEVRAHLAAVARDPHRSCSMWLAAAETRLDALGQAADAADVEAAVDAAHHQWQHLRDAHTQRALAPRLVDLRRRAPGRQPGALPALQQAVEQLNSRANSRARA